MLANDGPRPSETHRGHQVLYVAGERSWYVQADPDAPRSAASFRSAFLAKRAIDSLLDAPAPTSGRNKGIERAGRAGLRQGRPRLLATSRMAAASLGSGNLVVCANPAGPRTDEAGLFGGCALQVGPSAEEGAHSSVYRSIGQSHWPLPHVSGGASRRPRRRHPPPRRPRAGSARCRRSVRRPRGGALRRRAPRAARRGPWCPRRWRWRRPAGCGVPMRESRAGRPAARSPGAARRGQERDGRRWIRRVDVMRDLREEADRRDSVRRGRQLEHREARGRHAQQPVRPLPNSLGKEPGRRRSGQDRDRPRVRHGRRDRAEAGPRGNAELLGDLDDVGCQLAPSVVRLRPAQHDQVAAAEAGRDHLELRPRQVHRSPVDDVERGRRAR